MKYCLVYGQMSHWGATVITNLLSAIPFIGGDLVPLSTILPFYLFLLIGLYYIKKTNNLRLLNRSKYSQSFNIDSNLSKINPINKSLLALIIGFIDGDGYIRITKKSKDNIDYIYISLVVNLNENDLELLQYFNKHLNLGKVYNITPKKGNKLARWEMNKTDLFYKLIPLLEYNNIQFLTNTRQKQYLLLKYIKNNNLKYYHEIINHRKDIDNYINNTMINNNYITLDYFNNWLVGFTIAEGSFIIKKNEDICFQLKQKYNFELFKDITKLLNTTRKLTINKDKYVQFSVSSKRDIQNIINFFSFSNNHPLLGRKLISYNYWLSKMKESSRYNNLNIPLLYDIN